LAEQDASTSADSQPRDHGFCRVYQTLDGDVEYVLHSVIADMSGGERLSHGSQDNNWVIVSVIWWLLLRSAAFSD
jgi:hypothetical protein